MAGVVSDFISGLGTVLKGVGMVVRDVTVAAFHMFGVHQKVVEAGWFPSMLLPYQKLSQLALQPNFSADDHLRRHFVEHFDEFESEYRQRVEHASDDLHTREVLVQALTAHKAGLYFCVPPAIFAEVERAIRRSLGIQGRLGYKKIRELFREMGTANLIAFFAVGPVALTDVLTEHVYKDTWGMSEPEIKFLNRHQVMHGFKLGSGFKDSMNALLMAESVIAFLAWKAGKPPIQIGHIVRPAADAGLTSKS